VTKYENIFQKYGEMFRNINTKINLEGMRKNFPIPVSIIILHPLALMYCNKT